MSIDETMGQKPYMNRLTDLAITHDIDPVAHRELQALLREATEASSTLQGAVEGTASRYERLGMLGKGAIGEVMRVRDPSLGRVVALKVLRPRAAFEVQHVDRFVAEAQTVAQLQHPAILPVYELGQLPDGRSYFTMPEIRGTTLGQKLIATLASASGPGTGVVGRRRLVDHLTQAAEAVAYAHERGVLHRDLKPDNIMIGDFGEVYVVDWGLAKVLGRQDPLANPDDTITTQRRGVDAMATSANQVVGTPMYMAPEQARPGAHLTPAADVFSLGAMLLELLSGERPRQGRSVAAVLRQAMSHQLTPLPDEAPPALADIVRKATRPDPRERYATAKPLAEDLRRWLDGEAQRDRAREQVRDALSMLPGIEQLERRARALMDEAEVMLDGLAAHAGIDAKRPAWALQDEARALSLRAMTWRSEYTQALFDAVNLAPDLDEANVRLADYYRSRHREAELAGEDDTAQHALSRLRSHHRGRYATYLDGDASLSLVTRPEGLSVRIAPVTEVDRRWRLGDPTELGQTPLAEVSLKAGRWVLSLHDAEERVRARLPVRLAREGSWVHRDVDGEEVALSLPDLDTLGADDRFVCGGEAWLGGDARALRARRGQSVYVPSFVARAYPVTNAEWLVFLEALIGEGRAAEAQSYTPKPRAGQAYTWQPRWPVRGVLPSAALAFAAWEAERSGQAWRLPTEQEWEKLARGVDRRTFAFGMHLDPAWCRMRDSRPEGPAPVDAHPEDVSPYGIRGLTGNVRDWCSTTVGRYRVARGGAFIDHADACRAASRHLLAEDVADPAVGLRLVRDLRQDD